MHSKIRSFAGTHAFLSNFYLCEVMYDGVIYPSAEHAFQAAKTLSSREREQIRQASTPGRAKRLGRQVNLRSDWERIKINVMERIVRNKFKNEHLAQMLMRTGFATLIEGNNWHDQFWGNCICGRKACSEPGVNWLGKILMKVRHELFTQ